MSFACYPEILPPPLMNGYAVQINPGIVQTQMESGPTRIRRQSTSTLWQVKCQFVISTQLYPLFLTWFSDVTKFGTVWVVMPLDIGFGLDYYRVQFITPLNPKIQKSSWLVAADLQVKNHANTSFDDVSEIQQLIIDYAGKEDEQIAASANALWKKTLLDNSIKLTLQ